MSPYDNRLSPEMLLAAREVAEVSQHGEREALRSTDLSIARLTRGLRPASLDPTSPLYRVGVADALAAVTDSLRRRLPSREVRDVMARPKTRRILRALIECVGEPQSVIADRVGGGAGNLSTHLKRLRELDLIEPAPCRVDGANSWAPTDWALHLLGTFRDAPPVSEDRLETEVGPVTLRPGAIETTPPPPAQTGAERQPVAYLTKTFGISVFLDFLETTPRVDRENALDLRVPAGAGDPS
jgi:DNA-binding transcriptional ArsR family regulator